MSNFESSLFIQNARLLIGKNYCFLPDTTPAKSLPDRFHKIEQICSSISVNYSITGVGVRHALNRDFSNIEPELIASITKLTLPQKRYLMSLLSILAHCYRWDFSPPANETAAEQTLSLPAGLEELWRKAASVTEQPVVGTNANLKYWNWHLLCKPEGSLYEPDELLNRKVKVTHLWLSGPENIMLENWILTFILAEAGGARVIKNLLESIQFSINENIELCLKSLLALHQSIIDFNRLFGRLLKGTRVDADIWLKSIQHTFAWGIADSVTGEKLQGPSGMQVGVIQTLNLGLAIPDNTEIAKMSQQSRLFYTKKQQQFFDHLIAHASVLKNFSDQHQCVSDIYNNCINELVRWRVSHQKRGAWYLKKAGSDTNKNRISTGLTLPADVDGTEKFIEMMEQRIIETRSAKKE